MSEIKITINDIGEVEIEGVGFQDNSCNAAMAPFEQAIAGEQDRTDKPEAAVPATGTQQENRQHW